MPGYLAIRTWKAAAIVLAPALALCLVWLHSIASGGVNLTRRLTALENETARLRGNVDKLDGAGGALRGALEEARSVTGVLAKDDSPESLSPPLRREALRAGVNPRWIKSHPLALESGKDLAAWRYSLFVEGSFDQLASFINRIERIDQPGVAEGGIELPFFEIRDLNIAGGKPDAAESEATHRCTLVLHAYRPSADWIAHD